MPRKSVIKKRTPEQIMQANLRKVMRGAKARTEDSQELWLEFFQQSIDGLLTTEGCKWSYAVLVSDARTVADLMLDAYEQRWMKG